MAWKAAHTDAGEEERQQAEATCMRGVQALIAPYSEAQAPQRVLSQRMAKHLHELFIFVREPAVPADNNEAERALRHVVTSRRISGKHARR